MALTILCVGKTREHYYADAVAEYVKRLSSLLPCAVVEVADEPDAIPQPVSVTAIAAAARGWCSIRPRR